MGGGKCPFALLLDQPLELVDGRPSLTLNILYTYQRRTSNTINYYIILSTGNYITFNIIVNRNIHLPIPCQCNEDPPENHCSFAHVLSTLNSSHRAFLPGCFGLELTDTNKNSTWRTRVQNRRKTSRSHLQQCPVR